MDADESPDDVALEREGDFDSDVRALLEDLDARDDRTVRVVCRYEGDDYEWLYVRPDVREAYADDEMDERTKALMLKGQGDPPREESLFDFGHLDATVRWYHDTVVAHFPAGEWAGLIVTFDRERSSIANLLGRHLDA